LDRAHKLSITYEEREEKMKQINVTAVSNRYNIKDTTKSL